MFQVIIFLTMEKTASEILAQDYGIISIKTLVILDQKSMHQNFKKNL